MLNNMNFKGMATCLAAIVLLLGGCTQNEAPKTAAPADQNSAGLPPAQPAKPAVVYYDELYVDAEAEPDEGEPPLEVQFTSIVEDNTGAVECEWDFGDGSPKVKALNPKHTYTIEDDFIVVIECTDAKGVSGETEIDVSAYTYD
ncbi:MAG: PKD domain-containing protein [Candidatus Binatia bacterium]|nr:PKD domain-containing protein [Candidatus Binatia bacterium]MDG1959162.1 PKD domain-containing protein [Candidatus Binatia bacterium]MDG2011787.1 PKD domain-containing protein [Candidatus Binatia bacterium]